MNRSFHDPDVQEEIIQHMMDRARYEGWNQQVLQQAVVEAGFDSQNAILVFGGSLDTALDHFIHIIDRSFQSHVSMQELKHLKVRDRIVWLVSKRLELLTPYREALNQILRYQAHPRQWLKTIARFFQTLNEIWYIAGDQSTDFNYYTKRILLAGVYSSTFLYWLKDSSPQSLNTHQFLQNRVDQVMKISSLKQTLKSFCGTRF